MPEDVIGEPVVSVSKTVVAITKDEPIVSVDVTNSGTGTLTWTAVSDNDAVATASPSDPDLRNGDGAVLIKAPAGFDFDAGAMLETTVRVIDLTGATHDIQTIAVSIGTDTTDQPFGGAIGSGGVVCGAVGMITLPMVVLMLLGTRSIRLCRGSRRSEPMPGECQRR